MVEIPKALAESIRRGDCVLWTGAGLGNLADRPAWKQILAGAAESLGDEERKGVEALLDRGRLRPVLEHLRRTQADALREKLATGSDDGDLPEDLAKLAELPWASVFATVHADLARKVATRGEDKPDVVSPDDLDGRSLDNGTGRFVVHTPADLPSWVGHPDLHDVMQQAARGHTILLLGFSSDDPDLDMVLDALAEVSHGTRHFALISGLTPPECEAVEERCGLEVLDPGELPQAIEALADAGKGETQGDDDRARAALDLALTVGELPLRADVADAPARAVDCERVAGYVERLGREGLAGIGAPTLVRAGSVMLADARPDQARQCFEVARDVATSDRDHALARFGLAWVDDAEGKADAARDGLREAGKLHPAASLVPAGYTVERVLARRGASVYVLAKNADGADVELEVTTLARALSSTEREAFAAAVETLRGLEGSTFAGIRGGKARGRRLVLERDPQEGQTLAEGLATGVLGLEDAARLVEIVAVGLAEAHASDLVHGALTAGDVVLAENGPYLRGFGPVAALRRPIRNYGLAPEVAAGGTPTDKSDAYALATLAFRSMTGAGAVGGVPASMLADDLDKRVDGVLAKGLHPDPKKRATVIELSEALTQVLESEPEPEAPSAPETKAEAPKTVGPPEDPNDLEGWTWLLEKKPTSSEARAAIARIEKESRAAEQWDRVAEVLGVRAGLTQIVAERVDLLRELAQLYEQRLGVPANAFETRRRLLDQLDVDDQIAMVEDLRRLAETTGQWGPFADAVEVVAARVSNDEAQADLYMTLGGVQGERLGAVERAIAAHEKAAELHPSAKTLGALVPLYRKAMRIAELATTLLSLADHQEGADKVASLLGAVEVLQGDLGETEGAFAALLAVLEIDPSHAYALEQAEDLARQLEDWDSLVDMLARRAEANVDSTQAAEQLREAATVCLEQLEDSDRACELFGKLVALDRNDRDAANELATLLRSRVEGDPAKRAQLIDAIGVLVDLVETPDEKGALLHEQATLLDAEVDGKERAADARQRLLDTLTLDRPEAQEAALALEKHHRRQDDEDALVTVLELMGGSTDADEAFRVDAWAKLLTLRKSGTEDAEGAIAALEQLTGLQPDEKKWRDELLVRYLDKEDFKKAGPLIRAQVFDEEDPKRKAELLLRGGLLREQIGKVDGAIEALEEAVELDDSLHEAWLALQELYANQDQPLKALEAQVQGAKRHPNRSERVRLTFEAAKKFVDDFGNAERGMELLEDLVEFDPDHREATGMLVERLVGSGDLERAWPHAQTHVMQVRSQLANDKKANVRALSTAGRCALAVGEKERARDYLEKARTFDATNLDVLRLLADLAMDAGEHADALRHYQSVVLGVGSKLPPPELSQLYVQMADAREGMGEHAKSVQMAERALEIDAENDKAIDKLIALAESGGDASALMKAKRRRTDLLERRYEAADDEKKAALLEERVAALRELAKLQSDAQAPIEAVRTLETLMELKPDDPGVLHEILGMFTKNERWQDATRVIERLADAQTEPAHRAKYLFAGALIYRDHLQDVEGTISWIRRVLEADPSHPKAYATGIEMLEQAGNHRELARLMRARLKSLPKNAPAEERVKLFAGLGQVYEEHLGDPKTAIAAYNQSVRFATGELAKSDEIRERRVKVMRLAVQLGDDEMDKAIMQGHALISDNPMEFEVYHRLVELYLRRGDKDRARQLSRTLVFLKQADEAEQALAGQSGGAGSTVRRKISRELWRKAIRHKGQNPRISDILGTVWPMVAAREGHTHKTFGVKRADRTEIAIQSPVAIARFMAHACQVLDAPQPDFFVHDEPGGLVVDALVDVDGEQQRVFTSVLAGKQAQAEKAEPALKFLAGRAVARSRPDHILGAMLRDAGSLRNALFGAVAVSVPGAEIPSDIKTEATRLAELYKTYLSPSKIEQMGKVAGKLVDSGDVDTKRWLESAAHTVTRAGFVLCDDIQTAARILTNEGDAGLAVPVKDRIRDLVGYSVSDAYLKLRREIGLAI